MSKILIFLAFLFVKNLGYANDKGKEKLFENKPIHPIDSSFGWVDSVLINYFVPANASQYYITFNRNSVTVWSGYSDKKIITNQDTVALMKNYVQVLFISGTEKTEIGRRYNSGVVMSDYDQIRIKLFAQKDNYLTHTIYSELESCNVEFSDTFKEFYKLIRILSSQVTEIR